MYSELYTHQGWRANKMLISIALIVAVSSIIFYFTGDSSPTRASKNELLQHEVVNISARQFGVFWSTDEADEGWIIYGTSAGNLDTIALAERDLQGEQLKRKYHLSILRNLEPGTVYYYKIISDNEIISLNGAPFEAQTLPLGFEGSSVSPIYGEVSLVNGEPAKDVFAMLSVGNATPIVALSGSTGEWLIPLQYVVGKVTMGSVPVDEDSLITLQLFNDDRKSTVRSTIGRSRPLPETIILGNNYSFITDSNVLSAEDSMSGAGKTMKTVDIRYPKQNAVIPGTAPLIKGYGVPGENVEVRINSKPPFTSRARVDNNGEWDVPVQKRIAPGRYTLSVITNDAGGDTVEVKREFTLIKSGERVLGEHTSEATPSGTLTPQPTVGITTQPNPTVVITTATPTPTVAVMVTTPTPSVTDINVATPTPAPPVSGFNMIPFLIAGFGMIILSAGVILLF